MNPIPLTETQMAELFRLRAENAALKEQVAQLQGACQLQLNINDTLHLKLQGRQSKSAALEEALEKIIGHDKYVMFQRCPDCDYNCAGECKDMPISDYGKLAQEALATVKGELNED